MKGFKDFLMRGNLVEIATGLIIATAFGAVVTTFTNVLMSLISKVMGGPPNFDEVTVGGIVIGPFITALITFVIIAAVVYFLVIVPYQKMRERFAKEEEETTAEEIVLLREIRDSLARR